SAELSATIAVDGQVTVEANVTKTVGLALSGTLGFGGKQSITWRPITTGQTTSKDDSDVLVRLGAGGQIVLGPGAGLDDVAGVHAGLTGTIGTEYTLNRIEEGCFEHD